MQPEHPPQRRARDGRRQKDAHAVARQSALHGDRGTPPDDSLPPAITDQARELNRRLVWLETLDMEPLAGEANLLGAVLARIEDAVGARFPGLDKMPETVPLLYRVTAITTCPANWPG